jgi:hypothetical protein|tara:strand:+ start:8782 stop:9207 length:426 start_codon:yes stop_codon:yes gene_type:complete
MLHIIKGQTNNIPVTLKEKRINASGTTVYYYLKLVNDMSKKEWYGYGFMTHYDRYSNFAINDAVGSPPNTLLNEGFHTYSIYEVTSNAFGNDGDASLTDDLIVEQGKAFVKDNNVTEVSYTQYTPTDNTNTTNSNTTYIKI